MKGMDAGDGGVRPPWLPTCQNDVKTCVSAYLDLARGCRGALWRGWGSERAWRARGGVLSPATLKRRSGPT